MTATTGDRHPAHEPQEAYDGPATLVVDGTEHPIGVTLRGAFQPLDGHFHWYGRIAASGGAELADTLENEGYEAYTKGGASA